MFLGIAVANLLTGCLALLLVRSFLQYIDRGVPTASVSPAGSPA